MPRVGRIFSTVSALLAVLLTACVPAPPLVELGAVHPAPVPSNWSSREHRVTLSARDGTTFDALILRPPGEPIGGVILFSGGSGKLDLANRAPGWSGANFLIRSRMNFAAEGFVVASIDTPSDQPAGMSGFRLSQEHLADIAVMVDRLRRETKGKVWLIGTSMGTVSAAHAGAASQIGADGIVLTSTVTVASRDYPFSTLDAPLENIRIPVLIVHHWGDACFASRWQGTEQLLRRLVGVPKVERITVEGGLPARSSPCEAYSAHGYLGLEAQVVNVTSGWMKKTLP